MTLLRLVSGLNSWSHSNKRPSRLGGNKTQYLYDTARANLNLRLSIIFESFRIRFVSNLHSGQFKESQSPTDLTCERLQPGAT